MTDAGSSSPPPPASAPQAKDVAVAALVLNAAAAAAIAAEAEEGERLPADPAPTPAVPDVPSAARHAVMPRRRAPIRRPRGVPPSTRPSGSVDPAHLSAHEAARDAVEEHPPPETRSELRDWIKDNATLLSNASLLISLAAFALVLQVATLLFAAWALLTTPIILLPLTALAVVFAFYRWYFRRYGGLLARLCGIIALLAVLLLSELLMVVVWAGVTGEQVTLQLWAEDVPGLQVQIED